MLITVNQVLRIISFINMLGQTVLKGTFSNTINVQNLEAGVYMLQVDTQKARFIVE